MWWYLFRPVAKPTQVCMLNLEVWQQWYQSWRCIVKRFEHVSNSWHDDFDAYSMHLFWQLWQCSPTTVCNVANSAGGQRLQHQLGSNKAALFLSPAYWFDVWGEWKKQSSLPALLIMFQVDSGSCKASMTFRIQEAESAGIFDNFHIVLASACIQFSLLLQLYLPWTQVNWMHVLKSSEYVPYNKLLTHGFCCVGNHHCINCFIEIVHADLAANSIAYQLPIHLTIKHNQAWAHAPIKETVRGIYFNHLNPRWELISTTTVLDAQRQRLKSYWHKPFKLHSNSDAIPAPWSQTNLSSATTKFWVGLSRPDMWMWALHSKTLNECWNFSCSQAMS